MNSRRVQTVKQAVTSSTNMNGQIRNKYVMKKNDNGPSIVARNGGIGNQSLPVFQRATSVSELRTREKSGKSKMIPIRHTLTSKLRMEKANPLLSSDFVLPVSEPSLPKAVATPIRRSTFNPSILQRKANLDCQSSVPLSEQRPTFKKNPKVEMKHTISRTLKDRRPLYTGPQGKNKSAVSSISSKPTRNAAVNKNCSLSVGTATSQKKSMSSLSCTYKKTIVPPTNNSIIQRTNIVNKTKIQSTNKENNKRSITTVHVDTRKCNKPPSKETIVEPKKYVKAIVNSRSQSTLSNTSVKTVPKKQLKSILRKSVSAGDLRKSCLKAAESHVLRGLENQPSVMLKTPNKSLKSVAFYSPLENNAFTPLNTPPPSVLRKGLEDWLAKRGKSSLSYRHLCCFGFPKNETVVSKTDNLVETEALLNETITLESSDSTVILSETFENNFGFGISIENSIPKGSSTPEKSIESSEDNKENNAYLSHPGALSDLKKLVHSGYPRDQCEQWLGLISKSHPAFKELPEYWECLAALEEARGDFSSAVDCYGKAVVKGADAQDIDRCLDELWEKFSSLSVTAVEGKRTPLKKLAIDKKQIFKSTVIKFALQQKAIKKCAKVGSLAVQNVNYIVTPVRRSSRRSQSAFRTTPTVKCIDTLDDLDQSIRETMVFQGNPVLNP